jgi:hypothetical protein
VSNVPVAPTVSWAIKVATALIHQIADRHQEALEGKKGIKLPGGSHYWHEALSFAKNENRLLLYTRWGAFHLFTKKQY